MVYSASQELIDTPISRDFTAKYGPIFIFRKETYEKNVIGNFLYFFPRCFTFLGQEKKVPT